MIEDVSESNTGNWGDVVSNGRVDEPYDHYATRGMDVQVRNTAAPMGYSSNPYAVVPAIATGLGAAIATPLGRQIAGDIIQGGVALLKDAYEGGKQWVVDKYQGMKNRKKEPSSELIPTVQSAYESPDPSSMAMIPYTGATAQPQATSSGKTIAKSSSDGLAPAMTGYDIITPPAMGYHPMADTYYGRRSERGRGGVNSLAFSGFSGSGTRDPTIARALMQSQGRY